MRENVWEREAERRMEQEKQNLQNRQRGKRNRLIEGTECVCARVCVCVSERERERDEKRHEMTE